jgi:hypothetical protein
LAKNVADKAAVVDVGAQDAGTDANHVTGRSDVGTGPKAQGSIQTAAAVGESSFTDRGVRIANGIANERLMTIRRIVDARGVAKERLKTGGCIGAATAVVAKSFKTIGYCCCRCYSKRVQRSPWPCCCRLRC